MTPAALLVALLLCPAPLPAHSRPTVSPDEEQNLHHYVQVLQDLLLSVPTKETDTELHSTSPTNVYSTGSKSPWQAKEGTGKPPTELNTAISSVSRDTAPVATGDFSQPTQKKKTTETTTAFWSIKPNNISVVLRTNEPFIEKEEPTPEPQPTGRQSRSPLTTTMFTMRTWTTTHFTTTPGRPDFEVTPESEDVPQLSGDYSAERQMMDKDEILRKITDVHFLVQHLPPGVSSSPESRAYIRASREYLKRSLALAAAAERRLEKMYQSPIFTGGRAGGGGVSDADAVINTLYNARPRLWEYLDVKSLAPEVRWKATAVVSTLKSILCAGQADSQTLIRKLLSNNIKILNLLNIPRQN
ncbi:sperm equatorial segment protein 1 [Perognathus longimembris pacificus]|uniref:sperm equatorial segment protein 1 n=1 Tax=Perognathus longimembris pacificus TaxID=214514 RepID=UPI0020193FA1|nr:sperm equatorial segment protein 1 [Perognathus longimembris pacificus]